MFYGFGGVALGASKDYPTSSGKSQHAVPCNSNLGPGCLALGLGFSTCGNVSADRVGFLLWSRFVQYVTCRVDAALRRS